MLSTHAAFAIGFYDKLPRKPRVHCSNDIPKGPDDGSLFLVHSFIAHISLFKLETKHEHTP